MSTPVDDSVYDDDGNLKPDPIRNCFYCGPWVVREDELGHNSALTDFERNKLCDVVFKAYRACPVHGCKKSTTHKGNGAHNGIWAGTLTMSPSDDKSEEDMIIAIKKIMRQKSCPVKRYVWYLEHTEAGTPHVHFMYETESGGRIERKHFKRLWSLWDENTKCGAGFRGGYHRPCHSETEYLAYVKKDESPAHEDFWNL